MSFTAGSPICCAMSGLEAYPALCTASRSGFSTTTPCNRSASVLIILGVHIIRSAWAEWNAVRRDKLEAPPSDLKRPPNETTSTRSRRTVERTKRKTAPARDIQLMQRAVVKLSLALCLAVTFATFGRAEEPRRPDVMEDLRRCGCRFGTCPIMCDPRRTRPSERPPQPRKTGATQEQ